MPEGGTTSRDLGNLPVGFRFAPTDEELVDNYLKLKILGMDSQVDTISIPEVDLCKWDPWELPDFSEIPTKDEEWFFFSLLDYKYSNGSRSNRATKTGFWKPTGRDRDILSGTNKEVIGTKKTLVFYRGRGHAAIRTSWVIHEYRADNAGLPAKRAYVLCRLKRKTDENTGSDISTPEEAVAGTGIHLYGPANNMTLGAGPSHHSSDIGNSQVQEMTLDEDPQLEALLNDILFTPPGSDWLSETQQGLDLDLRSPSGFNNNYGSMQFEDGVDTQFVDSLFVDPDEYHCEGLSSQKSSVADSWNLNHGSLGRLSDRPQSPLEGVYGKGGGSSNNTNAQLLQGICLQTKDRAEYGSVIDLPQNKNTIRESNKDCKVTEKANRKRSSIWNEPVGMNKKGSFSSPETASASHEPSPLPGVIQDWQSSELPIVQETWLINKELDNSSTGTGIHQNVLANNMTLGAGLSHHSSDIASDIGNSQVQEMTSDEDPQLPGLLNDITFTPPDSDLFSDTEQGLDLDLPSPSGFKNSYGNMQFQDGVDTEFADSLIVDPDEYHSEGLTGQRS